MKTSEQMQYNSSRWLLRLEDEQRETDDKESIELLHCCMPVENLIDDVFGQQIESLHV